MSGSAVGFSFVRERVMLTFARAETGTKAEKAPPSQLVVTVSAHRPGGDNGFCDDSR